MKARVKFNKDVCQMGVFWNFYLANQIERILLLTGSTLVNTTVITKDDWSGYVDPDKVSDAYSVFKPEIIIFDPFGVGEKPKRSATYRPGLLLAKTFDRAPKTTQFVWTCLEKTELPYLPNSLVIPQGMTLPILFQEINKMRFE